MTVTLSAKMQAFVQQKLDDGEFSSPEQVVELALATLQQHDPLNYLPPGEMQRLVEEGMAAIAAGDVYDGEGVFEELERLDREQSNGAGR